MTLCPLPIWRQGNAMPHCEVRARWKVARDLRFELRFPGLRADSCSVDFGCETPKFWSEFSRGFWGGFLSCFCSRERAQKIDQHIHGQIHPELVRKNSPRISAEAFPEAPAILFFRSDLIFALAGKRENKIWSKKYDRMLKIRSLEPQGFLKFFLRKFWGIGSGDARPLAICLCDFWCT